MLDVSSLEKRWLKYKLKRYLPIILSLIILILLPIIWYTLNYHVQEPKPITIQQVPKKQLHVNKIDSDEMILEPSMQFIQTLPLESVSAEAALQQSLPKKAPAANVQNHSNIITAIKPPIQPATPPPAPIIQEKQPNSIGIKRDSNTFNISEIEERFKTNSNPHLGLYIARYYFDHGNYNEAYNYALKTNAINNSMEESWLIFAKSLIKMGKTEQAKKTLQMYLNQTNSENAKNLLDSINNAGSK